MLKTHNNQIWIRVPINQTSKMSSDPWQWWDQFRGNLNTEKRLNLALVLGMVSNKLNENDW